MHECRNGAIRQAQMIAPMVKFLVGFGAQRAARIAARPAVRSFACLHGAATVSRTRQRSVKRPE